jgi:hypothetical protein
MHGVVCCLLRFALCVTAPLAVRNTHTLPHTNKVFARPVLIEDAVVFVVGCILVTVRWVVVPRVVG